MQTGSDNRPCYAKVLVDLDVPNLDAPFDYQVPPDLADAAEVGSLVQVRFGPRRLNGYIVGLDDTTQYKGKTSPLLKVITPMPVVSSSLLKTIDYLALRYASNRSQLLSFVVPARRARVEKGLVETITAARETKKGIFAPTASRDTSRSAAARVRLVQTVLPGQRPLALHDILTQAKHKNEATLLIAASAPEARVLAEEVEQNPDLRVGLIDAEQSADRRYRTYLKALLAEYDVLIGTRSATWVPLPNLGSIIIWDEGDDRLREQRSPHLEALDVAVARSHIEGLDLICLGYARSIKAQALIVSGWARSVSPSREQAIAVVPRTTVFDAYAAQREGPTGFTRLPEAAYRLIRKGLDSGAVLIHVTAAGDTTELEDGRVRIGSDRIRAELSKAFPKVETVVSSSSSEILTTVPAGPRIVVATSGAEPTVAGGYAATIIAGASQVAYRDSLDATVEALRRWMNALSLAAPRSPAMLIGDVPEPLLDSLVYWEPGILTGNELRRRQEIGFPPARWVVAMEGTPPTVQALLGAAEETLGEATPFFPGLPFPTLALIQSPTPIAPIEEDKVKAIISVGPRNIHALMASLTETRRKLSLQNKALPSFSINPKSLIDSDNLPSVS